ncbi:hypothetical protein QBC33DRAFT_531701 [Phialemonium atrogriseum]|uniref:Uncharacterized protein n=1 Tax=Phialemonium atrogriseum TaxID=1093897 RepID=A0AAJ0FJA5_9PEZI|nr:uncharacterized protein QBC33DRAFT_531701 [Phialemonium atrogriseum]KAK1769707.1 hypothetical protein QBC33DRAFT_531701 [Phialemonium atrogriseum]
MKGVIRKHNLEALLCPFRLVHPVFLRKMTPDKVKRERAKAEEELVEYLIALGA